MCTVHKDEEEEIRTNIHCTTAPSPDDDDDVEVKTQGNHSAATRDKSIESGAIVVRNVVARSAQSVEGIPVLVREKKDER